MSEELLPKGFFKNNPIKELSAANIFYFKMTAEENESFGRLLSESVAKGISAKRLLDIEKEKDTISVLDSGEKVVAFMRTKFDIMNQNLLCRKALSMQDEVIPLMLQRYCTTYQDVFVETAVRILAYAEKRFAENLLETYQEIRNPYAKSMACIAFGKQHIESAASLLLSEYERMKKEHAQESLCQGPLIGLYALYGKI